MNERKWKVLLVDDEPSILKVVGKRLQVEGYDVVVAADGQEAMEKAQQEHPDLIVLDLMLPKLSGFDVCVQLKKDRRSRDIPIITIFSGKGSTEDADRCRQAGAAAYVSKGHGAGPLLDQIKTLLKEFPGQPSPPA